MKKIVVSSLFATFLFGARWAGAAIVQYDLEQMTQKSKLVVTGEVLEVTSYYAPFLDLGEVILTDVRVRIDKTLRGSTEEKEITIQVLGGQIGTAFQRCPESPEYEKGERVLVFLREWNGRLWNTGWHQGKYKLEKVAPSGTAAQSATQPGVETVIGGRESMPIPADLPLSTVESQVRIYSAAVVPREIIPPSIPPGGRIPRSDIGTTGKGGSR